jgi:putative spermidine/putrescine transport system permease protein
MRWLPILFLTCAVAFLILPILIVIPMSFSVGSYLAFPPTDWGTQNFQALWSRPEWRGALLYSLQVSAIVTAIALPIGTAAAFGLEHVSARWRSVLRLFVILPLVVPLILLGFALYVVYAQLGWLNWTPGLVLSHLSLAIPYVTLAVGVGVQALDRERFLAARLCGADPTRAFRDAILPQLYPSLMAGGLFAFVASFDEAVIALFIASGENSTITRQMFTSLRDRIDPTVSAVSTLLLMITLSLVVASALRNRNTKRP